MKNSSSRVFVLTLLAAVLCLFSGQLYGVAEEAIGNEPLSEYDYVEHTNIMPVLNHKARVYHIWANGDANFYYSCESVQINEILRLFAEAKPNVRNEEVWNELMKNPDFAKGRGDVNSVEGGVKRHIDLRGVVLRPGPAEAQTFGKEKIPYNVNLHIVGGICSHLSDLDQGELVWNRFPVLSIYINDVNELEKITFPKEVTILQLGDLKERNRRALSSSDRTVRGWGAGNLAGLDVYDEESVAAIMKLLDDPDDWVRFNAAGALSSFGRLATSAIPALQRCVEFGNEQLSKRAAESIASINSGECRVEERQRHNAMLRKIGEFVEARRAGKKQ